MPNDNRFSSGPLQQTFAITASDATKYAPLCAGFSLVARGTTIINEEGIPSCSPPPLSERFSR